MKKILSAIIFLILITVAFPVHAEPYNPCADHVCLASFDFGFNYGFGSGSGSGGSGPTGDGIQLETADFILAEDSKYLIQE
jgi:hypothetical protein